MKISRCCRARVVPMDGYPLTSHKCTKCTKAFCDTVDSFLDTYDALAVFAVVRTIESLPTETTVGDVIKLLREEGWAILDTQKEWL